MKHGTALIQMADIHALNILRLREFSKTPLQLKKESILWNSIDQRSQVLGVWRRGELIASMRLEKVEALEELKSKLSGQSIEKLELVFPVAVLDRLVISSREEAESLAAHLRYHLLRLAFSQDIRGVFTSIGSTEELVYLDLEEDIGQALRVCARSASESLLLYPYSPLSSLIERSIV